MIGRTMALSEEGFTLSLPSTPTLSLSLPITHVFVSPCPSVMWGHSEKVAMYKPGGGPLWEPNHTNSLIFYVQAPELWEYKFLFLKPSNLWYFVIAAWAEWDKH